jgi:hypothetical protein
MHAETTDHCECGGKERDAGAGDHESARLSFETGADSDG